MAEFVSENCIVPIVVGVDQIARQQFVFQRNIRDAIDASAEFGGNAQRGSIRGAEREKKSA